MTIYDSFCCIFFSCSYFFAKEYKDTVILNNGDIIKCEILSLKQRVLTVSTDYSDSDFQIEWEGVKSFATLQLLTIYTKKGHPSRCPVPLF